MKWSLPVAEGGLAWSTYKAICVRSGDFKTHKWNDVLADPMVNHVAPGWDKVFNVSISGPLEMLRSIFVDCLQDFHRDAVRGLPSKSAPIMLLEKQLSAHEAVLSALVKDVEKTIEQEQRKINRTFPSIIKREMQVAYNECALQKGSGMLTRMREIIREHASQLQAKMFSSCASEMRDLLKKLLATIENRFMEKLEELFRIIERDYVAALTGSTHRTPALVPEAELHIRQSMMEILDKAQHSLREALQDPSVVLKTVKSEPGTSEVVESEIEDDDDSDVIILSDSDGEDGAGEDSAGDNFMEVDHDHEQIIKREPSAD